MWCFCMNITLRNFIFYNKTLCEKIKEKYNNIDDITFTKQEQNQLQQYGLQKNDMITIIVFIYSLNFTNLDNNLDNNY